MCKKTSFILIALISMCFVKAQDAPKQESAKMEFGFHGGPGSSIFFNQQPMQNPRNPQRPVYFGGLVGISYQYNFTKMVGLHIETNYERKGDIYYSIAAWDNPNSFHESFAFDRLSYITVPVTARFSFGKRVKFFVDGGLYAGLLVNAQRVISDTRYTPVVDVTLSDRTAVTDITKDVRTIDGGVVTGIGVFLPVGDRAAFTMQARNNVGFANLNTGSGLYQNRFYNNSMVVLMGLSFALDKPYNYGGSKKNAGDKPEMRY